MPRRNESIPRTKSSSSYARCTVAASGAPSLKCSVPIRVSTVSGVVILAGTLGAYLGASVAALAGAAVPTPDVAATAAIVTIFKTNDQDILMEWIPSTQQVEET